MTETELLNAVDDLLEKGTTSKAELLKEFITRKAQKKGTAYPAGKKFFRMELEKKRDVFVNHWCKEMTSGNRAIFKKDLYALLNAYLNARL